MFFDFRRTNPTSEDLVDRSELRQYEYVTLRFESGKLKFFTRLLLEQRFQKHFASEGNLTQNYYLNHRIRFKWQVVIPVEKKLSWTFSDKPMINFGPNIVHNTFDHNRLITMANYTIWENLTIRTGYMNWIFQRPFGNSFDIRHIWLLQLPHWIKV
jgi:hypothetical protein